jgi:mRNA-degrading endonuclease toxin of MazEF toxin-antitoxin module
MEFIKNFTDWFKLKPAIDNRKHKSPLVSERQIWWCHLGENIGTEISGKGSKYTRPAIVYKKLSRFTFLVIPTSTQIKEGSWYVKFEHKQKSMVACLHQIKVIDYKRLDDLVGKIDQKDFDKIKSSLSSLYNLNQ